MARSRYVPTVFQRYHTAAQSEGIRGECARFVPASMGASTLAFDAADEGDPTFDERNEHELQDALDAPGSAWWLVVAVYCGGPMRGWTNAHRSSPSYHRSERRALQSPHRAVVPRWRGDQPSTDDDT